MTKRIVIGPRANGDVGMFVSPPGVDADTALDSALLLNVTSKVSQLILLGSVNPTGSTIALGLSRSPFVFVTSQFNFSGVIGHTAGPGPIRPSPMLGGSSNSSSATINSNGASVTINAPATKTVFAVYGAAFT